MQATYMAYRLVRGLDRRPPGRRGRLPERARHHRDRAVARASSSSRRSRSCSARRASSRDAASWIYLNAQVTVTLAALTYLYLRHNRSFYFVRNMFVVAWAIALARLRAVPDRAAALLPRVGLRRQRRGLHRRGPDAATAANALFNPYAAVPSMHVAFALMIAVPLATLAKTRPVRWFWTGVPAARHVRDRDDRQPLRLRRRPRRRDRRRAPRPPPCGSRAPGRSGASTPPRHAPTA